MTSTRLETIDGIGLVRVTKKRGVKRVSMRMHNSGEVRVTIPYYVPFSTGFSFAMAQKDWIAKQQDKHVSFRYYDGMKIGKTYVLKCIEGDSVSTRTVSSEIRVKVPHDQIESTESIKIVKNAIKRALNNEAKEILPERVAQIALMKGFTYGHISVKPMKVRWGACSSTKDLTFNCYLMMLPWELIDYVIVHELAHTKHMNHSASFWEEVALHVPNHLELRKQLRGLQPSVHALYV